MKILQVLELLSSTLVVLAKARTNRKFFSSSLSFKCALRESGCRIGSEPKKMSRDHFWRSISGDTNVGVSAMYPTAGNSSL